MVTKSDKTAAVNQKNGTGSPRVLTIFPQLPFLKTLAEHLISGQLIEGFCPRDDPLSLADCTLYLPTRRAARAIGLELLEAMSSGDGGRDSAILLPRIRTLGDLDESENLEDIGGFAREIPSILDDTVRKIDPVERHLTLARLAKGWISSMSPQTRSLFEKEQIVLPSSSADALRLASDLANFMDQIETEEADWSQIRKIADDGEHARWWQLTLEFLEIIMSAWPGYLAEIGKINPAQFRRLVAEHRIELLRKRPPKGPVIAAGSTGSIPATARFLRAISELEKGAVVLPGFDRQLAPEVVKRFHEAGELTHETASSTHPQYAMARLLRQMNLQPVDVREIGTVDRLSRLREGVINTSLLPAEDTGQWAGLRDQLESNELKQAFENTYLIEAPDERSEALAIALVLRETLESPSKTAALVTPDRALARRVAGELERFGIEIDDSAGGTLLSAEAAVQLRHLLRMVLGDGGPVSQASFFKGSLARKLTGGDRDDRFTLTHKMAGALELVLVRDCLEPSNPQKLGESVRAARSRIAQSKHVPTLLTQLNEEEWSAMEGLVEELTGRILPLIRLRAKTDISVADLADALLEVWPAEPPEEGRIVGSGLNNGEEELFELLSGHVKARDTGFRFHPAEAVAVFDTLLASVTVRKSVRTHPRLQIFGTLEARLQDMDRIVLGGLNEGTWPPTSRNDPFLNRPMRSGLGLPLPERRVGLAAHDFVQLSGKREVFYTRSKRVGDAPSIASRWLQRMEAYLGKDLLDQIGRRGDHYLSLAGQIDAQACEPGPVIERTSAAPPAKARPSSLSFTEIETWIRDPYAIYARHVLALTPFPPLVRKADPALRGTLYHGIFADFISTWQREISPEAASHLSDIADRHFGEAKLPGEVEALWRPRFDGVARGFLKWEADRRKIIAESHCEISAAAEIADTGFTLRGRADRIDVTHEGRLIVLDYKTGTHPSSAQARTLSPQLSLEGALAMDGHFKGVPSGDLAGLNYIRLREDEKFKVDDITRDGRNSVDTPQAISEKAYGNLVELIKRYQRQDQAYVSRYAPVSETEISGNYDHLARVREWSIAEEGDGTEET